MRGVGHFASTSGRERFGQAYERAPAALPSDRREQRIETRYGSVVVHAFGRIDGPVLVLLPGRSATSAMWAPNAAGLAERAGVVAVDLLGEPGRSVQAVPIRGAHDQAAWLDEVIGALDVGRAHLVGASIGGWLAFNQALRAPGPIASVSLLEPANVFARFSARMMLSALAAAPMAPLWARGRFLDWLSGAPVPVEDPTAELISAAMDTFRLALPAPAYPSDDELRSVGLPVLALLGEKSTIHDAAAAERRARALLRRGEVEVVAGASHALPSEAPYAVDARVLAFVQRVERETTAGTR